MKKITAFLLCVVLVMSCFMLSSCERKIDDINGLSAGEAYTKAVNSLAEIGRYRVDLSFTIGINARVFNIPIVNAEDFYFYVYDGDNGHYGMGEDAMDDMDKFGVADVLEGFDDELWYYENTCYIRNGESKSMFYSDAEPFERSKYEKAVSKILSENTEEIQCYKKGDEYYFTVVSEGLIITEDAEEEIYTVYFDEDGRITRIHVEGVMFGFMSYAYESEYSYDDVPPVAPPEDAEAYEYSEYYQNLYGIVAG